MAAEVKMMPMRRGSFVLLLPVTYSEIAMRITLFHCMYTLSFPPLSSLFARSLTRASYGISIAAVIITNREQRLTVCMCTVPTSPTSLKLPRPPSIGRSNSAPNHPLTVSLTRDLFLNTPSSKKLTCTANPPPPPLLFLNPSFVVLTGKW